MKIEQNKERYYETSEPRYDEEGSPQLAADWRRGMSGAWAAHTLEKKG